MHIFITKSGKYPRVKTIKQRALYFHSCPSPHCILLYHLISHLLVHFSICCTTHTHITYTYTLTAHTHTPPHSYIYTHIHTVTPAPVPHHMGWGCSPHQFFETLKMLCNGLLMYFCKMSTTMFSSVLQYIMCIFSKCF